MTLQTAINSDARRMTDREIDAARCTIGGEKLSVRVRHWCNRRHDLKPGPHGGYLKVLNVRLECLNKTQEMSGEPRYRGELRRERNLARAAE